MRGIGQTQGSALVHDAAGPRCDNRGLVPLSSDLGAPDSQCRSSGYGDEEEKGGRGEGVEEEGKGGARSQAVMERSD